MNFELLMVIACIGLMVMQVVLQVAELVLEMISDRKDEEWLSRLEGLRNGKEKE